MQFSPILVVMATAVRVLNAKICPGMDIRNYPSELKRLTDCVIVNGSLHIVLLDHYVAEDYVGYSFPMLKEISEHLILFRLKGITSLESLFPNLKFIRGRSLFKEGIYMDAMIIYDMPDLEEIGLPNLRQIQRGNVQIGKCPELCYVKTIDWGALGTSLSSYADVPKCKHEEVCNPECDGHCWAPGKCQRISENCHFECLGCSKPNSAKHCLVCKNWKNGDTCVSQCPSDKFLNEDSMACVTEDECNNFKSQLNMTTWVFGKWCLRKYKCPDNYELVDKPKKTCKLCEGPCYKKCSGTSINNKQHMEQLKGCTHIEGHLELRVRNGYEIEHLEYNLLNITQIDGCLKVARADALSSLHFLRNLRRIGGVDKHKFCNNHTVYVYENINLKTLIDVDRIKTGSDVSIGFHNNPELCISEIKKFAHVLGMSNSTFEEILQEEKDVSPYSNGDRAPCGDLILNVTIIESYSKNVTFQWPPFMSNNDTVIAYTFFYILNKTLHEENIHNYDNMMCNDNGWRSQLIAGNRVNITHLIPFSTYAYWIKVYYIKNDRMGISKSTEIKYFETAPDDPDLPTDLIIRPLSPNGVLITWESPESTNGNLDHYELYAILERDDAEFINQRDYCTYPHVIDHVVPPTKKELNKTNDDDCSCEMPQENRRIFNFDQFCVDQSSIFPTKDCNHFKYRMVDNQPVKKRVKRYLIEDMIEKKIPANGSNSFLLRDLKPFSKYIFLFSACNKNFRGNKLCSGVLFSWVRTLANITADQVTDTDVRVIKGNTVLLTWKDPENPNGMIVAYNIEYKNADSSKSVNVHDCVTKAQHNDSGYVYRIENMDPGEYTIRVRPVSLYGSGIYSKRIIFQIKTPLKTWAIYLVIAVVLSVMLSSFILYLWYKKKTKSERVYLIPSINPEYSMAVYIEEGWELERDDVVMNEVLGQGSFGIVYSGYVRSKSLPCAVKTMNDTASPIHRTEFLKEAFVMRAFSDAHHVIKLFGVVSKDDPPLVIMELMERGDLKQYLRNARRNPKVISLPEMYQMAAQIADGMAYLSAKKYVHRDLAARNCMVAGDRTVKVGDFGMTKDIYETDYYRKGTSGLLPVRWMAPESLADGVFSSESDVWSYGIVLWEMVTLAEHPYQGMSNEQVLKFVTTRGRLGRPKDCPNVLWEIMEVCWEHKPSKRPLFIGIVEKLEPLAGQSFPLVSFYHSQAGLNYRMNYGRQKSTEESTANNDMQNAYLRMEDNGNLLGDNSDGDEDYTPQARNRKVIMVSPDSLSWPSSYSISSQTP